MPRSTASIPIPRLPATIIPLFLFACLVQSRAEVKLPALFSDHMVLQRGAPAPVWGWAGEGEKVTVTFRDQQISTTAKDGRWRIDLPPLQAGGPDTLVIEGNNTISLTNVMAGEVWVASGQSNMQWPLSATQDSEKAIAQANHPNIRLFSVPRVKKSAPAEDVDAEWKIATPETVPSFSAVAYYFGRDLAAALDTPIGLIHTSWGGSPAEVWVSQDALDANPDYRNSILGSYAAALEQYRPALEKFESEGGNRPREPWEPSSLYNGMIAPLIPYSIRGAIWYQGESNASRPQQYRTLFPDMIANWRRDWGQGDFPFLAVQLAPYDMNRRRSLEEIQAQPVESNWAELREAQLHATKVLPDVQLAVITDAGDKDDIHPQKKAPVGERLALAALGTVYGKDITHSGPVYQKMEKNNGEIILHFDHVGGGLTANGGPLTGFAVAGDDGEFHWADARIEGGAVIVRSDKVEDPQAVRFGWADFPVVNLFNKAGLPASPFRTDEYPVYKSADK